MADESFSDPEVADILNDRYIPIKVDREERPDIDATYMQACQVMTGSGGWPLTLVLTPALLPFFAATYIPKHNRHGMTGLISLLLRISELWETEKDRINSSGEQIYDILIKAEKTFPADALVAEDILARTLQDYGKQYDSLYGGFGQAPKFPAPHNLSLLTQIGALLGDDEAGQMAARNGLHARKHRVRIDSALFSILANEEELDSLVRHALNIAGRIEGMRNASAAEGHWI